MRREPNSISRSRHRLVYLNKTQTLNELIKTIKNEERSLPSARTEVHHYSMILGPPETKRTGAAPTPAVIPYLAPSVLRPGSELAGHLRAVQIMSVVLPSESEEGIARDVIRRSTTSKTDAHRPRCRTARHCGSGSRSPSG